MREHKHCLTEGQVELYMMNGMVMADEVDCPCHYYFDDEDYQRDSGCDIAFNDLTDLWRSVQ